MTSAFIIVFREVLEMALVIGIVLAATRELAGSRRQVAYGVAGGVLASALVALSAEQIAGLASGMGQELFNALILYTASALLIWTVVWMRRHGREIAAHVKHVGQSVVEGSLPMHALAVVVGIAVLREGAEIVLFMYGAVSAGHGGAEQLLIGSLLGLALGAGVAFVTYQGLIRVPMQHVFGVTGWLLMLLAAGMAAQATGYLISIDVVPALIQPIWDTSNLIPEHGWIGQILHILVGYDERPAGLQVAVFAMVLAATLMLNRCLNHRPEKKTK